MGLQWASPPRAGCCVTFVRWKSQEGAIFIILRLRERPWALGVPHHPSHCRTQEIQLQRPSKPRPSLHLTPLPSLSEELKPTESWSHSSSQSGSSPLGEQRGLGTSLYRIFFIAQPKTQPSPGQRRLHLPQPPASPGSLCPPAQGALCARWHLCVCPLQYPQFPCGPRACSLQRVALAAPVTMCRVPWTA